MSFFIAILGLALLIFVHEAGHFFASLAVGLRPRKFYVGFPPALVRTTRRGIEYGVGTIPLGLLFLFLSTEDRVGPADWPGGT